MIYEFKVSLLGASASVWRIIQIDYNATFQELHRVLQVAFGWDDSHRHSFTVKQANGLPVSGVDIEPPSHTEEEYGFFFGGINETYDEREELLSDWFQQSMDHIVYTYNFNHNWQLNIVLLSRKKTQTGILYPLCTEAENINNALVVSNQDLEYCNPETLVDEINAVFHKQLSDLLSEG